MTDNGEGITFDPNASPEERIAAGAKAARIMIERTENFERLHLYFAIGAGLIELETQAIRRSGSQGPVGRGYNAALRDLLYDNPDYAKVLDYDPRGNKQSASELKRAAQRGSDAKYCVRHWEHVESYLADIPKGRRAFVELHTVRAGVDRRIKEQAIANGAAAPAQPSKSQTQAAEIAKLNDELSAARAHAQELEAARDSGSVLTKNTTASYLAGWIIREFSLSKARDTMRFLSTAIKAQEQLLRERERERENGERPHA